MKVSELYRVLFEAGRRALDLRSRSLGVEKKSDGSPVSTADLAIDAFLAQELQQITAQPSHYWSEERALPKELSPQNLHWMVDPIDGTKEFIKGSGEWVIQGALLQGHDLKMGFVFQPTTETLWIAESKGTRIQMWCSDTQYSELAPIERNDSGTATLVRSSSNPDPAVEEILRRHPNLKFFRRGSVGLKAVALCQGLADIYVNFSRQCGPWDLLPCIPLLEAAGLKLHWLDEPPRTWTEPKIQSRFVMGVDEIIQKLFLKNSL